MVIIAIYAMNELYAAPSLAGLASGIFLIASLLSRVFTGRVMEQVGKKKMLDIGVVIYFLVTLLYFWANTPTVLCVIRFLHGMGLGIAMTSAATIAATIVPRQRQGEGISHFNTSITLGSAVGPLIGLYLYQYSGFRSVLYLCLLLTGISYLIMMFIKVPEHKASGEKDLQRNVPEIRNYIEFSALPIALIGLIVFFSYSSIISFLSSYANYLQLNDAGSFFFFVYSLAIILSRPFTGRWFDNKGANVVMYPAFLCFAAGLGIASQASQGFTLLLSAVFMGFGFGTFSPIGQALAIQSLPRKRIGVATSTFLAIAEVGIGIGPFFIGVLIPLTGFRQLYILMAGIVILAMILYYFWYGRKKISQ